MIHKVSKLHQARLMIIEVKEYLSTAKGIIFYSNHQVGIVFARFIEK